MKKTLIFAAVATAGMIAAPSAQASLLAGSSLLMGPQTLGCNYDLGTPPDGCLAGTHPTGNYFAMDNDSSGIFEEAERVGIEAGTDGGIILGKDQSALGLIDTTWDFFGSPGNHTQAGTLTIASDDGNGNVTIDMTGWTVMWGTPQTAINMGTGAAAVLTCGVDCGDGDSFTLDYTAIVPDGGFAGTPYQLHMSGTISSIIPVPAAVWLFGSGLLGLVGVARRRKVA